MNGRIQENLHTQDNFDMSHLEMEKPMLSNVRVPEISGFPWHEKSTLRTNQCPLVVPIIFAN